MNGQLDIKFLTHIGCEIVVIGGVGFVLNRRISNVDARVNALEEVVKEQANTIKQLVQFINTQRLPPPPQNEPQQSNEAPKDNKSQTDEGADSEVDRILDEELEEDEPKPKRRSRRRKNTRKQKEQEYPEEVESITIEASD